MHKAYDIVVIGAGAAGLMCAITAGKQGRKVLVLEHNERVGKKILISGGGRCNFTNLNAGPANYLSASPAFCRSALARYTPEQFLTLVEQHGVRWHEKKLGQLFCDVSSREIVNLLLEECQQAGVDIQCNCRVATVEKNSDFRVGTNSGNLRCQSLVVATGGLSFPKLGATDFGYKIARQFGLKVTALHPGLVPLTLNPADLKLFGSLSGISLPVTAAIGKTKFDEAMLFTHRGLSGPAVLQISSYWDGRDQLSFNLLPSNAKPPTGGGSFLSHLSRVWPKRFAEAWCSRYAPDRPPAQCRADDLRRVEAALYSWSPRIVGTEGYPKAEVTRGGIDTRELSSKTMESRKVPGLYFIGEVVDVTGWLGGYNFQWAWASGSAAGLSA